METTYRLEFNEKQQAFHMDNYTHDENTHGWFTIFDHCTDLECRFYESYVNRIPKKELTKSYLLKCAIEVKNLLDNMMKYNLMICSSIN